MAEVEIKRKIRLTRQEAGERLIAVGTALSEGPTSELKFEGDSVRFDVADQLEWEFELEIDGDELELEIELKWSNGPPAAAAPASAEPSAAAKRKGSSSRGRS